MYQYVRLFGCVPVDGGLGRPLSSGESPSATMMKGTIRPSSNSTMPATGEGGRPPPAIGSSRLLAPFAAAAFEKRTLYTRAVPRFDSQVATEGMVGVCVMKVVVPNTVIAEVTTCS